MLASVLRHTQLGWLQHCPEDKTFWSRKNELALLDSCILWGSLVILEAGCAQLLKELHDGHPGISQMKALVHTALWWPGLDQDIVCSNFKLSANHSKQIFCSFWHFGWGMFCQHSENGIRHQKSAPYHPTSNGLVE